MNNDLYQRCRWCRNFADGKCTIANELFDFNNEIESIVDDGYLVKPLRDIIDQHFSDLLYALDLIDMESKIYSVIRDIESVVKNMPINVDGLTIKDPSTSDHYCKRFE